ncbi:hypothetical protein LTSERUB_0498, partial [Salmonella enterica subsp. enterica serovar Rubislaw str. A4-653]
MNRKSLKSKRKRLIAMALHQNCQAVSKSLSDQHKTPTGIFYAF